jgi:hypothetical protein
MLSFRAPPRSENVMALLAPYEFALKSGEIIRGATLYTKIERREHQPDFPGTDIRCDLERVNVVVTSGQRFSPHIYWCDEIFGTNGDAQLLRQAREDGMPRDIGLIEIPDCQKWIIRSEPTVDGRIGITILNSKGRILFCGIGDITPVEPDAVSAYVWSRSPNLTRCFPRLLPS